MDKIVRMVVFFLLQLVIKYYAYTFHKLINYKDSVIIAIIILFTYTY